MERTDKITERKPWIARLVLFGWAFLFWLLLTWPISPLDGRLLIADVVVGIFAAIAIPAYQDYTQRAQAAQVEVQP